MVAQVTVNHLVAGSNPAFGANFKRISFSFRSGAVVAQVTVNHLVAGSNPAFGANFTLECLLKRFFVPVSGFRLASGKKGKGA